MVSLRCRYLIFVTIVLGLPACDSRQPPMRIPELTDMATQYAAAWSSHDPTALATFYADDGVLQVNDGPPSVGRQAIIETAESYMEAFPDMRVWPVEVRRDGDVVEFHWRWTGTHTGPGGTGNRVDLTGVERWTLNPDGQIVQSLGHFDEQQYQLQLSESDGSRAADRAAILATFESWNRGWAERDAALAVRDYAPDTDWTNAFGDRFQSKAELQEGLGFIFGLDFVMAGASQGNQFNDVEFLRPDLALVRSKLIRTGQQTASGDVMPDRHINHLRVYEKREGRWLIVSHMISQAQPKGQ